MSKEMIPVEITDRNHAAETNRYVGLATAQDVLSKTPPFQKVPGYALAVALIDQAAAEQKALVIHRHLRAVAKAGIDVANVAAINLEFAKDGKARLQVIMMDLEDLTLDGSDEGAP